MFGIVIYNVCADVIIIFFGNSEIALNIIDDNL